MRFALAAIAAATILSGCASTGSTPGDPFEGYNRAVYSFNEGVDKGFLGPVSKAYTVVTPEFARTGVSNFGRNLGEPVNAINGALQGKPYTFLDSGFRFLVNSTIGIGGLFDPATGMGLERHPEDFGQTLAVWGVPEGPFVMIPVLGPSTMRDSSAMVVSSAINPLSYTEYGNSEDVNLGTRGGLGVLGAINTRAAFDDQIQQLREQPEPYVALRRIYLAQREAAVRDGKEEEDPYTDLPDFDDYDFDISEEDAE